MPDPFIGQIMMFGGNFAPRGWAFCSGALLPISQNQALFSILGTTYGGDGRTTFGLPDLRGRVAMHPGSGAGLTPRQLGQKGGSETETLTVAQMPSHRHGVKADGTPADSFDPTGRVPAAGPNRTNLYGDTLGAQMNGDMVDLTGGGQAHSNVQPFQCVNYIIALVGIFPSRN